jgi:hypothetical protein
MANKIIREEDSVEFEKYEDLSFADDGENNVGLFVKDEFVGEIEVFIDGENEKREYVCINYEVVYLDTITKR